MKPFPCLVVMLSLLWCGVGLAQPFGWDSSPGSGDDSPNFTNRVVIDDSAKVYRLGALLAIFEDVSQELTIADVSQPDFQSRFQPSRQEIPGFGYSTTPYWLKVEIENKSSSPHIWLLELAYPPAQWIDVYIQRENDVWQHLEGGIANNNHGQKFSHRNHVFELSLAQDERVRVYLRQGGENSKTFPLNLWRADRFAEVATEEYVILGIYFGIMLAMALYNAFIFFTVREASYAWYVLFLVCYSTFVLLLQGLGAQFFWGAQFSWGIPFTLVLMCLFGQLFTMRFIQTETLSRKIHLGLHIANAWFVLVMVFTIVADYLVAIVVATLTSAVCAAYLIVIGIYAVAKGNKPARYYLIAWVTLLVFSVVLAFRSVGLLPLNFLTQYSNLVGSALETILLSLALASRLNTLKEENQRAQTEINRQLERYSQDLENTVVERTQALVMAQKKLVIQEKISLLGVLSAGVSHEINTPNNVVNSSLHLVKLQILELQDFINGLLGNSEEELRIKANFKRQFDDLDEQLDLTVVGSQKINDIVSALRVVTRLNDEEFITADVTEGIESTIKLIPPELKENIEFVLDIEDRIVTECCAAELNQAFLNVIINACQALKLIDREDKRIIIRSKNSAEHFVLSVEDNGPGMQQDVLVKVFDPFYTTREVGEGSGLGLSSARDIIQKHGGEVDIQSELGSGTVVRVHLPLKSVFEADVFVADFT